MHVTSRSFSKRVSGVSPASGGRAGGAFKSRLGQVNVIGFTTKVTIIFSSFLLAREVISVIFLSFIVILNPLNLVFLGFFVDE